MSDETILFSVSGIPYSYEVMGEFTEKRMKDELDMAVELFEQSIEAGGLPAGNVLGHLMALAAEAFAYGRATAVTAEAAR